MRHRKSGIIDFILRLSVILPLSLLSTSCDTELSINPREDTNAQLYSFFVAGHVYGTPGVDNPGVHPPFKEKFDLIQYDQNMKYGVFTGDIVISSTELNWDEIDADLELLGLPVFFAVGQHDMSDRALYEQRYGKTWYSFIFEDDLFIVLDPNLDNWNISDSQLVFIEKQLENVNRVNNIFVFFHELLWWSPDNMFKDVPPNSTYWRANSINFWSEVEPLFHNLGHSVYMFSGDMGALTSRQSFMYYHYDNMFLIGSGMGNMREDNFIIVQVDQDKTVSFRLITLNGDDIDALGKLEDYRLPVDTSGLYSAH
jgi:hypothetical protein